MNIAAKVRARKEKSPELYCPVRDCLWRIVTPRGPNPCLKHPATLAQLEDNDARIAQLHASLSADFPPGGAK